MKNWFWILNVSSIQIATENKPKSPVFWALNMLAQKPPVWHQLIKRSSIYVEWHIIAVYYMKARMNKLKLIGYNKSVPLFLEI